MGRSGYSECGDLDPWNLICWRGAVSSAIRGKRGQAFLRELVEALEALPEKKLEAGALVSDGGCCAMGAVALKRGLDTGGVDPYDREHVASIFGIAEALAAEIAFENDDEFSRRRTPEDRWTHMHKWATSNLRAHPDRDRGEGEA